MIWNIQGKQYIRQSDLKEEVKKILYSYDDDEYLSNKDMAFMLDLLNYHENAEIKIGCGVWMMFVKVNMPYKTKGFHIVRLNGSKTDFSYVMCLKTKPESRLSKFKSACRQAVDKDMLKAKQGKLYLEAHHSGLNTFDKIVDDFISENKIDVFQVEIIGITEDNVVQDRFKSESFIEKFRDYHNQRAEIVLLTEEQHKNEHN
jgi:hypothetical protein